MTSARAASPLATRVQVAPDNGFTLVELLVAFVVSALLLTAIMAAVSSATSRQRTVAWQARALVLAEAQIETRLASFATSRPTTGEVDGLTWSLSDTVIMADPRGQYALRRLAVVVRDGDGQVLARLARRMLAPAQADASVLP